MIVQIVISLFGFYVIFKSILKLKDGDTTVGLFIVWNCIWLGLVVLVWIPQTFDLIGQYLGLSSRGVDIVAYTVILILVYAVYRITLKLEHLEYEITRLVRAKVLEKVKKEQR